MVHRCFPALGELMRTIRTVRRDWEASSSSGWRSLRRVYVLTNAELGFRELEDAWDGRGDEHGPADQPGGERGRGSSGYDSRSDCEVFLGNGVTCIALISFLPPLTAASSCTCGRVLPRINLMRMLDGAPAESKLDSCDDEWLLSAIILSPPSVVHPTPLTVA